MQATVLHRALSASADLAFRSPIPAVHAAVARILAAEPAVVLDHFGIADSETLEPLSDWGGRTSAVALIAAQVGPVRLIDNITLLR